MDLFIYVFLFIFWAVFWSFWSVLIRRLKAQVDSKVIKSILYGRSQCPNCDNFLWPIDLVPIFSWLWLKWKCRHCHSKISIFYLILEIFSWIVFCLSFFVLKKYAIDLSYLDIKFILGLVFFVSVNWILLLLIFADLLFFELNVYLWIFAAVFSILFQFFWLIGDFNLAFIWGLSFFAVFAFIYYFAKFYVRIRFWQKNTEWFWAWDVMVAFLIWLMLPFLIKINWLVFDDIYKIVIMYVFLSSLLWMIFALVKYVTTKGKYGQAIPFLPAMILWYWLLLVYWDKLLLLFDILKN